MPIFEQRCVAFLDVLGFKRLVQEAESSPAGLMRLLSLKNVLDNHVRWDNFALAPTVALHHRPKYIFISDSIILSSIDDDTGRGAVVAKCIEIGSKLLEMGFLLRGAIARGSVWHDASNVIGTGYIEAYQLKSTQAIEPRIILSEAMADAWKASPQAPSTMVLLDEDGRLYCNILHPHYVRGAEMHGRIESYFDQVKAWISVQTDAEIADGARRKWLKMREYYDRAVSAAGLHDRKIG